MSTNDLVIFFPSDINVFYFNGMIQTTEVLPI